MKPEAYGLYTAKGELSPLLPDFVAPSIMDVDFAELKRLGIKHILIDLDLTIRRVGAKQLEAEIVEALRQLKQGGLFDSISLMTNNYRAKRYADAIGIKAFTAYWENFRPIRKPNIKFFERVLSTLAAQPSQTVMIGDKVHADIIGANNAGLYTILVNPRGHDYWFDRVLLTRWRERRSLGRARLGLGKRRRQT
jgi:HAD superfamily phosphatase (TIGR01668 family)